MAKLVAVCRDEEFPFERRQIPLMIEEALTMVMEIPETIISTECVDEFDVKQFVERYDLMTFEELNSALMVTQKELFSLLAISVPCVGCRRSVERLYNQLLESGQAALEPLIIKASQVLTLSDSFLFDPRLIYALFYIHGSHLNDMVETIPKSRRNRWMDVWDLLSQECRDEVVLIDSDSLLETLENYLRKHRFCSECKSKVIKAYNILAGDIEGDTEKGYCATLYEGLKSCPKERHIHVLCDTDYIAHLIDRAEPELAGGRRERHARTIEIAQEEVLTCLGIHLWERLHRLWQKLRAEEQTWQMLFYLGVEALRKSFEMAVEDKQGISKLEQVVEEISEAERAKELKKEHKRLKKKKRKENKCKFENEKKELEEENCNGKENKNANIKTKVTGEKEEKDICLEEKPACKEVNETNHSLTCENSDVGSCKNDNAGEMKDDHVYNHESNDDGEKQRTGQVNNTSLSSEKNEDNCKCGNEKSKDKSHRKNGFINAVEEEERPAKSCPELLSTKNQKGARNGYITPPSCSSCGQSLSPRDRVDRGYSERGMDYTQYPEKCAKCASLKVDASNKRGRKKYGRQKEVHDNMNQRQWNERKAPSKLPSYNQEQMQRPNENVDDAELKLLKSMGWKSSDRASSELCGQTPTCDEAFITEQEIEEFKAKKKDLQNQREELREKLRQQFQTMFLFSGGIIFGWATVVPVFEAEGIFNDLCEGDKLNHFQSSNSSQVASNQPPFNVKANNGPKFRPVCAAQRERLSLVFTIATFALSAGSLPIGIIIDKFGPRTSLICGCILYAIATSGMIAVSKETANVLFSSFFFFAVGGALQTFPLFQAMNFIAGKLKSFAICLINGAFDSSAIVLVIFKIAYDSGINLQSISIFYSSVSFVSALILIIFLMPSQKQLLSMGVVHSNAARSDDIGERLANHSGIKILSDHAGMTLLSHDESTGEGSGTLQAEESMNEVESIAEEDHLSHPADEFPENLRKSFLSPIFCLHLVFLSVLQLRLYFFISSLNNHLNIVLDSDKAAVGSYLKVFGYIQLGGILVAAIIGVLFDRDLIGRKSNKKVLNSRRDKLHSAILPLALTTLFAILLSILSITGAKAALVPSFVFLVFMRGFLYASNATLVGLVYKPLFFGRIFGSIMFLSALFAMLQYPFMVVSEKYFDSSPYWVNVALLVSIILPMALPTYLWYYTRIAKTTLIKDVSLKEITMKDTSNGHN
eukprot:gene14367-15865_t